MKDEPGADVVHEALGDAMVSAVVFAECLSELATQGYDASTARARFLTAGVIVHALALQAVQRVLSLHALAMRGVSLADRVCLALALDRGVPVLTGDRVWPDLGLPLEVRLIR